MPTDILSSSTPTYTGAIIRWTRQASICIYLFPDETRGNVLAEVFRGDALELSLEYTRENWRLCRVGHRMGWINQADVKFYTDQPLEAPSRDHKQSLVQRLIGFFKTES